MPKMKTHKGVQKRVRVSAKGKVKHKRAGAGHLMSTKNGNRCRGLRKPGMLESALGERMRKSLAGARS